MTRSELKEHLSAVVAEKHNQNDIESIVNFLFDEKLIREKDSRDYLIIHDFYELLKENEGHVTNTFRDLSVIYETSETTIKRKFYSYINTH